MGRGTWGDSGSKGDCLTGKGGWAYVAAVSNSPLTVAFVQEMSDQIQEIVVTGEGGVDGGHVVNGDNCHPATS